MSDVTQILNQIESGDGQAAEKLLPLVYEELRKLAARMMAQEKPGQTLQPTALVHEAYLRLIGADQPRQFNGQSHFFFAAAAAMRRILIDAARRKSRLKHGGGRHRVDLSRLDLAAELPPADLLALDEAIEKLAAEDATASQLVRLLCFAGLSVEQAAEVLGTSSATAYRHWTYARAWLHCELQPADS